MNKLPAVRGEKVVKSLQKVGFEIIRQRGSHIYLSHKDGRATVVPVHKGEDLGPGRSRHFKKDNSRRRDK